MKPTTYAARFKAAKEKGLVIPELYPTPPVKKPEGG
jgi:hypothetical protein